MTTAADGSTPHPQPQLLIVDDDTTNIRVLGEVLRGIGRIFFATDGEQAVRAALRTPPDVVLLDAEMPGLSGFDVCTALKGNPATADASIIFVTAHSHVGYETRALQAGAVDFIAKPISPPIVLARVKAHLTLKLQADVLRRLAAHEAAARQSAVQREEAAREAVAAVVEASPRPLAVLAVTAPAQPVVCWANGQFAALFGTTAEAVLGRPLSALLPTLGQVAGTGDTRHEVVVAGVDGPAELELLFSPLRNPHPLPGTILLTAHDRTAERRAARQAAERHRLEALGRMAGRIAHEINNVLQPIMSHATLARHAAGANATVLEHIAEVQSGVRQGRDIVRSVLALAGGGSVARQPQVLEVELGRVLQLVAPTVPGRIHLDLDLLPTGGTVALGPADLLQVIGNLVTNAVDAIAGDGGMRLATRAVHVDAAQAAVLGIQPGSCAELTLSDTGAGMDEQTLARALDPFFTTKPVDKGTGLGLSTVRALVGSLGGSVSLSAAPGVGTTVRVLFPLTIGA